jgi:hypothetical protein
MPQVNRNDIKGNFRTGDRPTQEQFYDVFDSFLNLVEDQITVDPERNLVIGGSLTLPNTSQPRQEDGTIIWNGSEFQYWDSVQNQFVAFGTGGGGGLWQAGQSPNGVVVQGVNVGINTNNPVDPLQVEMPAPGSRVRLGTVAVGRGSGAVLTNYAIFSHQQLRGDNQFALAQSPTGGTQMNCAPSQAITLSVGNSQQASLASNGLGGGVLSIGRPDSPFDPPANRFSTDSQYVLQIKGEAYKTGAQDTWSTFSDARLKEDIQPFTDGLEMIRRIKPVTFRFRGQEGEVKAPHVGLIAQDVKEVFPYMVSRQAKAVSEMHPRVDGQDVAESEEDLLMTNMSSLKYVLVNAVKELSERVEALEAELAELRSA